MLQSVGLSDPYMLNVDDKKSRFLNINLGFDDDDKDLYQGVLILLGDGSSLYTVDLVYTRLT